MIILLMIIMMMIQDVRLYEHTHLLLLYFIVFATPVIMQLC